MSLIGFHRFLIATAILFCLGFAVRQMLEYRSAGDGGSLVMAVAFGAAAVGLGYYLWHLRAFLKLPRRSADLRPPEEVAARPGNGRRTWRPGEAPLAKPQGPAQKRDGHDE